MKNLIEIIKQINFNHAPTRPVILRNGELEALEVIENQSMVIRFEPSKFELYLTKTQRKGLAINGVILNEIVNTKKILNANVLSELMVRQNLIPETWKKDKYGNTRYILFWGTIYSSSDNCLYVRNLYWKGEQWCSECCWVNDYFDSNNYVALYP